MPQHRENSGESQQPAPEEPVRQSRVDDVAWETRESIARSTFRAMEYTLREMVREWGVFGSAEEDRFRELLADPRLSRHAQEAVMQWLKEKAVSADNFSDWWSDGMGFPIAKMADYNLLSEEQRAERMIDCYMRNVRRCMQIEACHTGSVRELSVMFNIHNVGRYAPETLVAQYEERENIHKPYVLVIFPRDDHNGAFYCNADILENLRQQLEKEGYLLRIIEGGDDILKTLARLHRNERYPLPAGLILGAHGEPNSMSFSMEHPFTVKTIEEEIWKERKIFGMRIWKKRVGTQERKSMGEGMDNLFQRKANKCPIVLISCSTGQPDGIAHVLSQYTEGVVSGPQVSTNAASISAQFDGNGNLTALVLTFHHGNTGVFEAGVEVPVAEEDVPQAGSP